jgi:thiol-disulfide isomerase/thioredoxin
MSALDLDNDLAQIRARLGEPDALLVACLCAQWCGVCREYRVAFDRLADAHPSACFVWIDVETHADQLDDLDIENFPTILIEDEAAPRFFGTVTPHAAIVERLLQDRTALPPVTLAPRLLAGLTA